MSANITPKTHIDVILKGVQSRAELSVHPDTIGQIFVKSMVHNLKTMWSTGPQKIADEPWLKTPYRYEDPGFTPSVIETLGALGCLEYQCSDYPGFKRSRAHQLFREYENFLIEQLPGYDDALEMWDAQRLKTRTR